MSPRQSMAYLMALSLLSLPLLGQVSVCTPAGIETFDAATPGTPVCGNLNTGMLPAGWANDAALNTSHWRVQSGSTPSVGTGPSGDHTSGSGNYLYTEASFPCSATDAYLNAPPFDVSGIPTPSLSFWYHMLGANQGTLSLEVWDTGSGSFVPVFSVSGDQGNQWIPAQVNLSAYVFAGSACANEVLFRFHNALGSSFLSDTALDDIEVGNFVAPDFQTNSPDFAVDINGVLGNTVAPAMVTGSAILCNGVTSSFATTTTVNSGVANGGFEIALNTGRNAISSSLSGAVLPDGQVINIDFFFPTFFLNGAALPGFVPFTAPLAIPGNIASALDLNIQGILLNPSAPLGLTLSQPSEIHVAFFPSGISSLAGPATDDGSVGIDVTAAPTCWAANGVPFYGTSYTTIFVMSNGRVRFDNGFGDFTPSVAEAQNNMFAGVWTDFSPNASGLITLIHPTPDLIRVQYSSVPYFGTPGSSSSYQVDLDAALGVVSVSGLDGIEMGMGANSNTVLGISPGGGANDLGNAGFSAGSFGGPFGALDMIYEFSPSGSVPTYPAAGGTRVDFFPVGGGYVWTAN